MLCMLSCISSKCLSQMFKCQANNQQMYMRASPGHHSLTLCFVPFSQIQDVLALAPVTTRFQSQAQTNVSLNAGKGSARRKPMVKATSFLSGPCLLCHVFQVLRMVIRFLERHGDSTDAKEGLRWYTNLHSHCHSEKPQQNR